MINFQTYIKDTYLEYFLWNCPLVNTTSPHWWLVNIGSGNGLVPSGNKPLPEPMLIQIFSLIQHPSIFYSVNILISIMALRYTDIHNCHSVNYIWKWCWLHNVYLVSTSSIPQGSMFSLWLVVCLTPIFLHSPNGGLGDLVASMVSRFALN